MKPVTFTRRFLQKNLRWQGELSRLAAKRLLAKFLLTFLLLPALAMAAEEGLLLDFQALTAKIAEAEDIYQIVDARNPAAQRDNRIAYARKYHRDMPLNRSLVLVVADTDEQGLAVAREIPAVSGREVFAVQGGVTTWREIIAAQPAPKEGITEAFGLPTNTCDPPVIIRHYKKKE